MKRQIDNKKYLNYLLQALNVNDLKQLCRDFEIKGYSKLKKSELVEFILDSLSEEELDDLIGQRELEIISKEMNLALKKINGEDRETISEIKIVNPKDHEIEISFKGFNWETGSYISITPENINDPERDCDCRIGSNLGFCSHFWVGFIYSLKRKYFNLKDWTLTVIPSDFEEKIKKIVLSEADLGAPGGKTIKSEVLVDKGSPGAILRGFLDSRITVYEGEILDIEERQSEFQGNITVFYLITLKNVKVGPQLKKASDYNEDNIKVIETLKIRVSEAAYQKEEVNKGEKISCNGGVTKDNFLGLMLKRVSKLKKL
jgi:hypothetical protein